MLQNKDKIWVSNEEWVFKPKTNLIYIQNILTKKVLGTANDGQVIHEDYGPIFLYDYGAILSTFGLRLKFLNFCLHNKKL